MSFRWKLFTLSGVFLPLINLLFLGNTQKFEWEKPIGVNSYIKLFLIDRENTASVSPQGGDGNGISRTSSTLIQASLGQTSQTNQGNNSKFSLAATIPLVSIDKPSSWKYCLSSESPLQERKENNLAHMSTSSSVSGDCELKSWTDGEETSKGDSSEDSREKIKYLLELSSKFIRLQHQVNMIYLFHSKPKDETSSNQGLSAQRNGITNYKKVESECGISFQKGVKNILLTSSNQTKRCMPFPLLITLYLKLKPSTTIQSTTAQTGTNVANSTSITLERIKTGEIWGQISYGLTDYWGNLKKVKSQTPCAAHGGTGKETPVLIEVPLLLNYDLSNTSEKKDSCSTEVSEQNGSSKPRNFEFLWKKYETKSLRLCDYFRNRSNVARR